MTSDDAAGIERLRRETRRAEAEVARLKKSCAGYLAERNTWARQMADLRDERDTAVEQAEDWRDRYIETDNECTAYAVRAKSAEARVNAARGLLAAYGDDAEGTPCDYEFLVHHLRAALYAADGVAEALP